MRRERRENAAEDQGQGCGSASASVSVSALPHHVTHGGRRWRRRRRFQPHPIGSALPLLPGGCSPFHRPACIIVEERPRGQPRSQLRESRDALHSLVVVTVTHSPTRLPSFLRARFASSEGPTCSTSLRDADCPPLLPPPLLVSSSSFCHRRSDRAMEGLRAPDAKFATKAIHVGQEPEKWKSMAIVPPISLATTFKQHAPGIHAGFEYSRSGNPTRNCLEDCLASLENCSYALTYASGLAATHNVAHLLKTGDHIICMNDVYGGTNRLFRSVLSEMDIQTSFVDCTNLKNIQNALQENTKLVWIETPTNPMLQITDIKRVAELVHKQPGVAVVVDNTFMTCYFQRPLELGADITVYSLTKYMNGHTDTVMGAVMTNNQQFYDRLKFLQNSLGGIPSPFDCFLVNRGLKTLHLRMREHMKNGLLVANFLEKHPQVVKVIHPGLPTHPQHELAKSQCSGFSGMITFYVHGGLGGATHLLKSLKMITLAESLGGYESLAEHPGIMTHASVPEEIRKSLGIADNMIRLSVGLEAAEDIIADLDQGLTSISNGERK